MSVPVLNTERLRMRRHELGDFEPMLEMWASHEVTRFIGGKPSTRPDTWGRLLRYIGHWEVLGYGYWAVEEKASGRYLGEVGFADFKRELDVDFGGSPEIGWALAPWAHGQGYATEAVRAALAWGEKHFGDPRAVCMISRENAASIRVAERAGFRLFDETEYEVSTTFFYERV